MRPHSDDQFARLLKLRILLPLIAALGILLSVFAWHVYSDRDDVLAASVDYKFKSAWELYQRKISSESELMRAVIEMLMRNDGMRDALLARDRERLLSLAKPVFDELKAKHNITHFYFHDERRMSFLRVYHPDRYGDEIRRSTLLEAERIGQAVSGMETGTLEGLTLRVVYPWRVNGILAGYVELGMEVQHIAEKLKSVLAVDVITAMQQPAAAPDTARPGGFSICSSTLSAVPPDLALPPVGERTKTPVQFDGKMYCLRSFPLPVVNGPSAGALVVLYDVTESYHDIRLSLVKIGGLFLLIGVSLVVFFHIMLSRVETKLRQARERELAAKEQAQAEKLAAMGILVSGVAHEINNPVNFIMFNAPMLGTMCESVQPILEKYKQEHGEFQVAGLPYAECKQEIPRMIQGIMEGADRIKRIVVQLKDFARDQSKSTHEKIEVNAVVKSAIHFVQDLLRRSTKMFSWTPGANLPAIHGDFHKLEQVVINLLVNACQALPSSDKMIVIATTFDAARNAVIIAVRDEGIGIPEEHMTRIKDPFFTTKRDQGGTGLGLSVSYGIVREHRGRLEYQSAVGKGTLAEVILPVMEHADDR